MGIDFCLRLPDDSSMAHRVAVTISTHLMTINVKYLRRTWVAMMRTSIDNNWRYMNWVNVRRSIDSKHTISYSYGVSSERYTGIHFASTFCTGASHGPSIFEYFKFYAIYSIPYWIFIYSRAYELFYRLALLTQEEKMVRTHCQCDTGFAHTLSFARSLRIYLLFFPPIFRHFHHFWCRRNHWSIWKKINK